MIHLTKAEKCRSNNSFAAAAPFRRNHMNQAKCSWNKKIVILCMMPPIILYLWLGVAPSVLTFFYSFTNITRTSSSWQFIGLENYQKMFFQQNYRDVTTVVLRTLKYAVVITIVQNIFALLLAVLFNSKLLKGRNFYRAVVFLPYVLGVTVCCYTWVLMMGMDGPVVTLLGKFGIKSALLGSKRDAFTCVMFIQIWIGAGYSMVLDLAGLQGIPLELYESASIDGASGIAKFFRITIPLLWDTISINVLLSITGSLGAVQTILLTTGGAQNTETLGMRIYRMAFGVGLGDTTNFEPTQGYAAGQAMILFLITSFFALLTHYTTRRVEKRYE